MAHAPTIFEHEQGIRQLHKESSSRHLNIPEARQEQFIMALIDFINGITFANFLNLFAFVVMISLLAAMLFQHKAIYGMFQRSKMTDPYSSCDAIITSSPNPRGMLFIEHSDKLVANMMYSFYYEIRYEFVFNDTICYGS